MSTDPGGEAVLEFDEIVVRVNVDALQDVVNGASSMGYVEGEFKVTDRWEFAKELIRVLNGQDEQGCTPLHKVFDDAIIEAIENGAFGIAEKCATCGHIEAQHPVSPELQCEKFRHSTAV